MKKIIIYLLLLLVSIIALSSCDTQSIDNEAISERVKIVLRDTGHQLLLDNNDSTSVVLPVTQIDNNKYQLRFEKSISFEPRDLVDKIKENINKLSLPQDYRVEVINSVNNEVAYSYEFRLDQQKTIISCMGRDYPKEFYLIELTFIKSPIKSKSTSIYYVMFFTLILLIIAFLYFKKKKNNETPETEEETVIEEESIEDYVSIGIFQFYPEQNKLIKTTVEIPLSRKECELLEKFVSQKNQIIKREDLMKEVWEDKGVVVGRSLDTYISKLRKKLKEDDSINIKNVHGVGYKLEVK